MPGPSGVRAGALSRGRVVSNGVRGPEEAGGQDDLSAPRGDHSSGEAGDVEGSEVVGLRSALRARSGVPCETGRRQELISRFFLARPGEKV